MSAKFLLRRLKVYASFLKTNTMEEFEYRLDFFLYTLSALVSPLLGLALWLIASNSGAKLGLSHTELITYFGVVLFVGTLNQTWHAWYFAEDINTGAFSKYLLTPFYVTDAYFIMNMTDKIFKIFFTTLLFVPAVFIFHLDFSGIYFDFPTIFLFLLAIILSFGISFSLESIIGISTFWFHDIDFLKDIEYIANQILTGRLIPLAFFPATLATLISFTPFRYVVSFPVEILMHKTTGINLVYGFALAIFWFIATAGFYSLLYKKGVVKFQAFG